MPMIASESTKASLACCGCSSEGYQTARPSSYDRRIGLNVLVSSVRKYLNICVFVGLDIKQLLVVFDQA